MTVIVPLDTGWMFGPASGGGAPTPVTLPHTVTPLSWQNWKPASWERAWLYANTFDAPAASSGMRVFLDFAGAMTASTVTLNNATVAECLGGYLPFSGEITRHLRPSGNQLSVLLDSTFNLNVPPDRPAPSVSKDVDFWQQVSPAVAAVIAPAFYWDFGTTSPVNRLTAAMICSNLDYLKVYVGGKLFTTVEPDRARYGHLTYPPSFVDFSAVNGSARPELRVDGYLGSALVASRLFAADHAGDFLSLKADDETIAGDGVDATRVVLQAVDRHGAPRPYVTGKVRFTIIGPHVLLGDNPFDFKRTGGAGAIWIRSQPGSSGTVTVKASHRTLGDAEVTISVASILAA